MSSELPSVSDAVEASQRTARAWCARSSSARCGWRPCRFGAAVRRFGSFDLLLAAGGLWAAVPGRRAHGGRFGEHGHWSSLIIALPIGFGIAAAVELWHMVRGNAG